MALIDFHTLRAAVLQSEWPLWAKREYLRMLDAIAECPAESQQILIRDFFDRVEAAYHARRRPE